MQIFFPKEEDQEIRTTILPEVAKKFVDLGLEDVIEEGLGSSVFIEDELSLIFDSTPSWVSLNLLSGNQSQLFQGESANYNINVNTDDNALITQ